MMSVGQRSRQGQNVFGKPKSDIVFTNSLFFSLPNKLSTAQLNQSHKQNVMLARIMSKGQGQICI